MYRATAPHDHRYDCADTGKESRQEGGSGAMRPSDAATASLVRTVLNESKRADSQLNAMCSDGVLPNKLDLLYLIKPPLNATRRSRVEILKDMDKVK